MTYHCMTYWQPKQLHANSHHPPPPSDPPAESGYRPFNECHNSLSDCLAILYMLYGDLCKSLSDRCIMVMSNCLSLIPVQYSTVQYSAVQYSTVQCSTVQYSAVQCRTVQYCTVPYSTVQYNMIRYYMIQYDMIR